MRFVVLLVLAASPGLCGDWSPRLAAGYLDAREKSWFEWPVTKAAGGPCVSCHTNLTYLLARPSLRKALGESEPGVYERGLLDALRARVDRTDGTRLLPAFSKEPHASEALGVEAIFAALFLPDSKAAFDRLWSLQIQDGPSKGAWKWFSLELDPWEMPDSVFYGATLAALAVSNAPAGNRDQPHVDALISYVRRTEESQPLHNRLMLLWASAKLPTLLPEKTRSAIIDEALSKRQEDGGWTMESLGPWKEHAQAPAAAGSNAYATALAAFALEEAGVPAARVSKSLNWLKVHQNPDSGNWTAISMNKRYAADSMMVGFMNDAATAFASLALVNAR
ncbi:MAG TPA: hypothetical protein VKU01_03060 [Bryobacteraceae bacterium]|nr:hypothetical protein [Bryobacteraceae bacterium]